MFLTSCPSQCMQTFFCYIFEELNIDLYISQNIGLEIENKT